MIVTKVWLKDDS